MAFPFFFAWAADDVENAAAAFCNCGLECLVLRNVFCSRGVAIDREERVVRSKALVSAERREKHTILAAMWL